MFLRTAARRAHFVRKHGPVITLYSLITVLFAYPTSIHLTDRIGGADRRA